MIRAAFWSSAVGSELGLDSLPERHMPNQKREQNPPRRLSRCALVIYFSAQPVKRNVENSQNIDLSLLGTDTSLHFQWTVLFSLHDRSKFRHLSLSQLDLLKLASAQILDYNSLQLPAKAYRINQHCASSRGTARLPVSQLFHSYMFGSETY